MFNPIYLVDFSDDTYGTNTGVYESSRSVSLLQPSEQFFTYTISLLPRAEDLVDRNIIAVDFANDAYEAVSFYQEDSARLSFIFDDADTFYSHAFTEPVVIDTTPRIIVYADFVEEIYQDPGTVPFLNDVDIFYPATFSYPPPQSANCSVIDDSIDVFYIHDFEFVKAIVSVSVIDDSIDAFYAPTFDSSISTTSNIINDSVDVLFDARFAAGIAQPNVIDESIDDFYSSIYVGKYSFFKRIFQEGADTFYPIDVDFDQFVSANKYNDTPDTFFNYLFVPALLVDVLDDSTDTIFSHRINYVHIRPVTLIDDLIDKIYPVGFFGITLPPVNLNEEFFTELSFDPYPAPIVSSQVVAMTIEPINFTDSGVVLSNYPQNGSANVSAYISGKYTDLFAPLGRFEYVEQGSSDLLQPLSVVSNMNDIPDDKSITSFDRFLRDRYDQVDYKFTVDYRLADLPEINTDSQLRMVMWLDSASPTTVITDANNVVTKWEDKSTFNNDAIALYNVQTIPGANNPCVEELNDYFKTDLFCATPNTEYDNSFDVFDLAFGYSVAVESNTVFAAAIFEENANQDIIGGLYVYEYDNGTMTFKQKITPTLLTDFSFKNYYSFGDDMDVSGDTLVVGAGSLDYDSNGNEVFDFGTNDRSEVGGVFIFEKNALTDLWEEKQIIIRSDGQNGDNWGRRVAISGDLMAFSSFYHEVNNRSYVGGVYIYKKNATTGVWEQQTLIEPNNYSDDPLILDYIDELYFGSDIALDGDTLVVSAPAVDPDDPLVADFPRSGSVYVYKHNNGSWSLERKINEYSTQEFNMYFGHSVDIKGDTILTSYGIRYASTIFIYERSGSTWTKVMQYQLSDTASLSERIGSFQGSSRYRDLVLSDDGLTAYVSIYVSTPTLNEERLAVFKKISGTWTRVSDIGLGQDYNYTFSLHATNEFIAYGGLYGEGYVLVDKDTQAGLDFQMSGETIQIGGEPQIYYDGNIDGKPAIRHKYSNTTTSHTLVSDLSLTGGVTMFVVMKELQNAASYAVMGSYADTSNTDNLANSSVYGYIGYQEANNTIDSINLNNPVINYYVNDYVIDPSNPNDLYVKVNEINPDVQIYTFTFDQFDTMSTGLLDLSDDINAEKDIAEIIVYDQVLPKNDVQKINAYLANKWNVANTNIMTQIQKKYGDITYTVIDSCGGSRTFDSSIYTYSQTLNHIVYNIENDEGTQFLDNYLKDYAKRPDC